jgi:protoheme ferro-lyase
MVLLGKDILGGKWQNSFLSTSVIYDSVSKSVHSLQAPPAKSIKTLPRFYAETLFAKMLLSLLRHKPQQSTLHCV